jgi:hypothetical protein
MEHFTKIYSGRHVVGRVYGDTFVKRVDGSRHFLRNPAAICFDVGSLRDAQKAGACYVEVIDKETDQKYRALISLVWDKGFRVNRGYGDQIALRLDKWLQQDKPYQLNLNLELV